MDDFLTKLKNYDKDHIHDLTMKAMEQYLRDKSFNRANIEKKSMAAGGLCDWAINICGVRFIQMHIKSKPTNSVEKLVLSSLKFQYSNATGTLTNERTQKFTKIFLEN